MSKKSKLMISAEFISEYQGLFICPICANQMKLVNYKSLVCSNNHSFDLSRQGYLNLLSHSIKKTKYDKRMFESRMLINRKNFFEPLHERIAEVIGRYTNPKGDQVKLLDAGCGEGSHINILRGKLTQDVAQNLLGVGIDISKEGIYVASREYPGNIWCVADISKCPFTSKQFDIILNILSPCNYSEFKRVLYNDGLVIKVIPEGNYLHELRQVFYGYTNKVAYSNNNTLELFQNNLNLIDMDRVRYTVTLENTLIEHLVNMTPLSWGATKEQLQNITEISLKEVTIDLTILLGKKKNKRL